MSGQIDITWAGEHLTLDPHRAVIWPARRAVFVADPHFGKAAAFRHAGVPVPAGTSSANLRRLAALLNRASARRLVILGDFLHARTGRSRETLAAIASWRREHESLEILLVRGNHDQRAGDPPPEWRLECVDEPHTDGPFALCHHPEAVPADRPGLAGHVHPAVRVRDDAGGRLRCPCFCFGPRRALLPAFGSFTGTHVIRPEPDDRVFLVGPGEIAEVATV